MATLAFNELIPRRKQKQQTLQQTVLDSYRKVGNPRQHKRTTTLLEDEKQFSFLNSQSSSHFKNCSSNDPSST